MQLRMFRACENFKILRAIVRSVAVDVMDMLISIEFPAKQLFHNDTMLKMAFTNTRLDFNITVLANITSAMDKLNTSRRTIFAISRTILGLSIAGRVELTALHIERRLTVQALDCLA
ncbi:hypothetical protein LCGC14_3065660 [marine sediment metagenome]|uniref:Uncharacterized protein n=1 Tax=marine sediment metagenome TaxID=412755 RepID=A0A0F8YQA4_9ZZZZ